MATSAAKKKTLSRSDKAMAEIRDLDIKQVRLSGELGRLRLKICDNACNYAYYSVEDGIHPTSAVAIERLAKALKRPYQTIMCWVYTGYFMEEHSINPAKAEPRSVSALYGRKASLPRATLLQAVSIVKNNGNHSKLMALLNRSKPAAVSAGLKRYRQIEREKGLNLQRMKMEAMTLQTILSSYFGETVTITATGKKGKLLEVK